MNNKMKWNLLRKFSSSLLIALFAVNATVAPIAFGDEPQQTSQPAAASEQVIAPVAEAPQAAPQTPVVQSGPRYIYVMSKPLELDSELGKTATFAHYGWHLKTTLLEGFGLFQFGGIEAAAAYTAIKLIRYSVPVLFGEAWDIRWQSRIDLEIRSMFKLWKAKGSLKKIPDIKSYALVVSKNVSRKFVLNKSLEVQGFLVFETTSPLSADQFPQMVAKVDPKTQEPVLDKETGNQVMVLNDPNRFTKWGTPLLVSEPEKTVLRLSLNIDGKDQGETIDVNLFEILAGEKLTNPELGKWRDSVTSFLKKRSIGTRAGNFFNMRADDPLKITGKFVFADGTSADIGTVYQNKAVKKLLKIGISRSSVTDTARRILPFVNDPPPLDEVELGIKIKTFDCKSGIKLE